MLQQFTNRGVEINISSETYPANPDVVKVEDPITVQLIVMYYDILIGFDCMCEVMTRVKEDPDFRSAVEATIDVAEVASFLVQQGYAWDYRLDNAID